MTVTREPELEREFGEIACARRQSFQRGAQPKLREISMNRHAGLLLKNPGEVKWRSVHRARDFIKRDAIAHSRREIRLRCFRSVRVVPVRAFSLRPARYSMFDKRRFKHISDELERRDVSPKRFEGIGGFETLHELPMTPEDAAIARSGKESERLFWMIVYGRVELAHDVVEYARRNGEHSAAIAAIRWMTDAICQRAREKHRLVHVSGRRAPSEVARERAVPHQNDVVRIRFFLRTRPAAFGVTAVVVHADDRAPVQRTKDYFFIALVTHKCYRSHKRDPSSIRKIRG